jgi:hypothetical protein
MDPFDKFTGPLINLTDLHPREAHILAIFTLPKFIPLKRSSFYRHRNKMLVSLCHLLKALLWNLVDMKSSRAEKRLIKFPQSRVVFILGTVPPGDLECHPVRVSSFENDSLN